MYLSINTDYKRPCSGKFPNGERKRKTTMKFKKATLC